MKYKPLILLVGLSLLILLSVGTYQWWQNQQDLQAVEFLSDPDWSKPTEVITDVFPHTYELIPEESGMTAFWAKRVQGDKEEMYVRQIDDRGNQTLKPMMLTEDLALRSLTVQKVAEQYHLFWLSGQNGQDLSLKYRVLDQDFNLVLEQILVKHLVYTRHIKSSVEGQAIYLTWFTSRNNFEQVDLAKLDLATGRFARREVTNTFLHSERPNLAVNDGQVHLSWLQQNPARMIRGDNEAVNRYFLMYQRFDLDLRPLAEPFILATAAMERYEVAPQIAIADDEAHFIWRRFAKETMTKVGTPPLSLYHTTVDWNNLKNYKITKITNGNSKEPNLLETADGYLLTYIDVDDKISVKYADLTDLGNGIVYGEKLFPGRRQATQPKLMQDSEGNRHLLWVEDDATVKKVFYATTKYPHRPGVLETLGINLQFKDMQFVSAMLYFTVLPLLSVFGNVVFVMIVLIVCCGLALLTYCSKYKYFSWLRFLQGAYVSYLGILAIVFFQIIVGGNLDYYFTPWSAPEIAPFILLIASIAGIYFLYQIRVRKEMSLFVGGFVTLVWYYWIIQATLIFNTHSYFLR